MFDPGHNVLHHLYRRVVDAGGITSFRIVYRKKRLICVDDRVGHVTAVISNWRSIEKRGGDQVNCAAQLLEQRLEKRWPRRRRPQDLQTLV
ncbi:Uncharacterised protein [Mycobacteroides abscessus subsp. abscessus]|nr:Uncharacterised protein [Mycobacteroides abscessus subsp. abscessus]